MPPGANVGENRFGLDGRWTLDDLANFSHYYGELYAFFDSLEQARDQRGRAYPEYPWRGGYSATHFFQTVRHRVAPENRPRLVAIEYASPGFITIVAVGGIVANIRRMIDALCGSVDRLNATYSEIMKGIHDRKLNQLDLRQRRAVVSVEEEKARFIKKALKEMSKGMGLSDEQRQALGALAEMDEWPQLKILLALYRRAAPIAALQGEGKLVLAESAKATNPGKA